jgi:hypothetical protein
MSYTDFSALIMSLAAFIAALSKLVWALRRRR